MHYFTVDLQFGVLSQRSSMIRAPWLEIIRLCTWGYRLYCGCIPIRIILYYIYYICICICVCVCICICICILYYTYVYYITVHIHIFGYIWLLRSCFKKEPSAVPQVGPPPSFESSTCTHRRCVGIPTMRPATISCQHHQNRRNIRKTGWKSLSQDEHHTLIAPDDLMF